MDRRSPDRQAGERHSARLLDCLPLQAAPGLARRQGYEQVAVPAPVAGVAIIEQQ